MPGSALTRPKLNDRMPCGTRAAAVHHRAHGQIPCGTCRTAGGDDCTGCTPALAEALRARADVLAAMLPAGQMDVVCAVCGRGRAYTLLEVTHG